MEAALLKEHSLSLPRPSSSRRLGLLFLQLGLALQLKELVAVPGGLLEVQGARAGTSHPLPQIRRPSPISCRQAGGSPSSPQYSSTLRIRPF